MFFDDRQMGKVFVSTCHPGENSFFGMTNFNLLQSVSGIENMQKTLANFELLFVFLIRSHFASGMGTDCILFRRIDFISMKEIFLILVIYGLKYSKSISSKFYLTCGRF